ncbi:unnamed protein product [Lampetra fluviatilis]
MRQSPALLLQRVQGNGHQSRVARADGLHSRRRCNARDDAKRRRVATARPLSPPPPMGQVVSEGSRRRQGSLTGGMLPRNVAVFASNAEHSPCLRWQAGHSRRRR